MPDWLVNFLLIVLTFGGLASFMGLVAYYMSKE